MAKKLKMHFRTDKKADSYNYRLAACGYWLRREITTIVSRRVTCLLCLKQLRRHRG